MTAPFPLPPAVALLERAIERVRPMLMDENKTTKERTRILWAAVKRSCNLGAWDVVQDEFMNRAVDVNLIDQQGRWVGADVRDSVRRHGGEDVLHAIYWALRGANPFEQGR